MAVVRSSLVPGWRSAAAVLACAGAVSAVQAAPVLQEGFESGDLSAWYTDGNFSNHGAEISTSTVFAGNQSLKVFQGGPGEGTSLSQVTAFAITEFTIATAGDYLLNFQFNRDACSTCAYQVLVDGTAVGTGGAIAAGWQSVSIDLSGLGAGTYEIGLGMLIGTFTGLGQYASYYDELSLAQVTGTGGDVPEPATFALALAALGLTAATRRRQSARR